MHSEAALVGRQREIEELLGGVEEAKEGNGKLFLITGEPGIGKTRLAEEVAGAARKRSAQVVWSRCWNPAGSPAYWPWIQIVRGCLSGRVGAEIRSEMEPALADISRILPNTYSSTRPRRNAALSDDPEEIRFRLFEAILRLLTLTSKVSPLILVLDDLGAADIPSLLLLKFLAHELHNSHILLLATYRDSDLRSSPFFADAIGEIVREAKIINLHGLTRGEVAELVRGQVPMTAENVEALSLASGGNPFFVQSILKLGPPNLLLGDRQILGQGRIKFILGLRAAIEGHLRPLSTAARTALEVASVIGREFDAEVLASAIGRDRDEVLEILAQAEACGLVTQVFEAPGWCYRFVHTLVADGLYEGIPAVQRQRMHNDVGCAIEEVYGEDLDPQLTALAHHFFEGARLGESERARKYAERAAERASAMVAFEEAARCYQMALAAMGIGRRADRRHRCELLLAMAETQHRSGDYDGARDSFSRAAEVAEQLGDGVMLAHAALGYPNLSLGVSSPLPEDAVRLLERALKALSKRDDPWRVMIMARLAAELPCHHAAAARRRELVEKSAVMARRSADQSAVLAVLEYRDLSLSGPDLLGERFKNAEEMIKVAEEVGNHFGVYIGTLARADCFRQWGQVAKAEAEVEAMMLLGRLSRLSVCGWGAQCFAAYRALLRGHFDDAQRLAREALEFAERMRGAPSGHIFWPAMIAQYRERGRIAEIEPIANESLRQRPASALYRALLATVNLHLGRNVLARAEFEAIADDGFTNIPRDGGFLACCAALAELCAAFDDSSRAAELLKILKPYTDLHAVFGPLAGYGAVARYAGLAAATAQLYSEAEDYFGKAIAMNAQADSRTYAAYTRADYAAMLLRRGAKSDLLKASHLLEGLQEFSEAIGMNALAVRVLELTKAVDAGLTANKLELPTGQLLEPADLSTLARDRSPVVRDSTTVRAHQAEKDSHRNLAPESDSAFDLLLRTAGDSQDAPPGALSRDGDYWTIQYNGQHYRLKHVKGLACLAVLLAHPGTEVHSVNLAMLTEGQPVQDGAAATSPEDSTGDGLGDAGPMLDARAKAEYKRRLTELRAALEQARDAGDAGAIARAEDEIDFIEAEISRAVGLGGRDRMASSVTERARLSVTKSIKSAVAKIAQQNRDLGNYLAATIRTGNFCSYQPDPELPLRARLA